jgi:hypothetical protein
LGSREAANDYSPQLALSKAEGAQAVGRHPGRKPHRGKKQISYNRIRDIRYTPVPRPNPDARIGRNTHRI